MKRNERQERPVPRPRSGIVGRRSERTGSEPLTAQSALGLRTLLASGALVFFAAACAAFAYWSATASPDDNPGSGSLRWFAVVCGAIALLAVLNLVALLRRRARERPPRGSRSP